jgi:hypothetical protein
VKGVFARIDPKVTRASAAYMSIPIPGSIQVMPKMPTAMNREPNSARVAQLRILPFLRSENPVMIVTTRAIPSAMITPAAEVPASIP